MSLGSTPGRAQDCTNYPDLAVGAPSLNTRPSAEYAEWARSYQGMPAIERMANGRLWAAWTSGGTNEGPANYVVLVTSSDEGRSWSEPRLVIDPAGNVAALLPVLWRDPLGRLWFFWNQGYGAWWDGRGGTWAVTAEDSEAGVLQWGRARRIADGWIGNKPTVLRSGEWLLPIFVHHRPVELAEETEYLPSRLDPVCGRCPEPRPRFVEGSEHLSFGRPGRHLAVSRPGQLAR